MRLVIPLLFIISCYVSHGQATYFKQISPFNTSDRLPQSLLIEGDEFYISGKVFCYEDLDSFSCLVVSKHNIDGSSIWESSFKWSSSSNQRGIRLRNDSLFIGGHITPGESSKVYKLVILNTNGDSLLGRTFDFTDMLGISGFVYSNGIWLTDDYVYNFGMSQTFGSKEELPVHRYDISTDTDTLFFYQPEFGQYFPGWDMEEDKDGNLLVLNEIYRVPPSNSSIREILKINKEGQVLKRTYGPDYGDNSNVDNEFILLNNGSYFFLHHIDQSSGSRIPQLINMDTSGAILWTYDFPRYYLDDLIGKIEVREVIEAANGDIVLTGYRERKKLLGSGNDIWLMRVSPQGQVLWEKTYNTPDDLTQDKYHFHAPTDVQEFDDGSLLVMATAFHHGDIVLLRVDENGCIDDFGCNDDILLPVDDDIRIVDGVKVYPNPNNGVFTVNFDSVLDGKYAIYNMAGDQLDVQEIEHVVQLDLDYTALPDGLYYLIIDSKESRVAKKVMIDRD